MVLGHHTVDINIDEITVSPSTQIWLRRLSPRITASTDRRLNKRQSNNFGVLLSSNE